MSYTPVKKIEGEKDYPIHDYVMENHNDIKTNTWGLEGEFKELAAKNKEAKRNWSHNQIKDSILDCVGNTPLVRVNNITREEGIECEVLVKCEFLNPGGSTKDRIGRRMVLDAIDDGRIKKGDVLLEPTSGNTGIGLSMAAAALGFRMIITMPEKMSQEKRDVLTGLGAEIVRTPNEYAFDHYNCHIGVALQLRDKINADPKE